MKFNIGINVQVFLYKDRMDTFGTSIAQRAIASLMPGDYNLFIRIHIYNYVHILNFKVRSFII